MLSALIHFGLLTGAIALMALSSDRPHPRDDFDGGLHSPQIDAHLLTPR
ncbi:hypothetical protein [Pseudactinotalea sp. Z1748]